MALTIDDSFCRQDEQSKSLIQTIRRILKMTDHKVTFFTTAEYACADWKQAQVKKLLGDGHELGNHCADDRCVKIAQSDSIHFLLVVHTLRFFFFF